MAFARTQKGAQERVKKKHFVRACGFKIKPSITNKDLNKLYRKCKKKQKD